MPRTLLPLSLTSLLLACAALAAAGCSGEAQTAEPPEKESAKKQGPPPALVRVSKVRSEVLREQRTYLGYARSKQESRLSVAVAGQVTVMNGRVGDRFDAGQTIVSLDTSLIDASIAAARAGQGPIVARLAQARREAARAAKLPHPVMTKPERERLDAEVRVLRAQLGSARAETQRLEAELALHVVKAPFAGVVRERHVELGGWLRPGDPVLTLVSADALEVVVDVAANLRSYLQPGSPAKLARGSGTVDAKVVAVLAALDPVTRTLRVRLEPTAASPWLMAGLPVDVGFEVQVNPDNGASGAVGPEGLVVSRDALVRGPVNVRVFKLSDGAATPIEVEVLATVREDALVRGEGLVLGDEVIVRGNERLRPGQAVVADRSPEPAPARSPAGHSNGAKPE